MIVVAIVAAIVGGILNGSFNVFMRGDAPTLRFSICPPKAVSALDGEGDSVKKREIVLDLKVLTPNGWQYENAWLFFTLWSVVLSFVYCYSTIPPESLHEIFRAVPAKSLGLLIAFSFMWGIGTITYGQIISMLGMSLGTSLIMAVVVCIGTALPLIVFGAEVDMQLLFIILGIVLAVLGFGLSAYAGLKRDAAVGFKIQPNIDVETQMGVMADNSNIEDSEEIKKAEATSTRSPEELSFMFKVGIALVGGMFASQLQFGFVFGNDLIKEAEKQNISKSYAPLTIWYWAFMIAAIPNIIYCCIMLNRNRTWSRFRNTPGFFSKCFKTLIMSAMWSAHIHLYGFSTEQFGEDIGAALSWPILMSSTVFSGQICAILFEEWKCAPDEAIKTNWLSMFTLFSSVASLAIAGLLYA